MFLIIILLILWTLNFFSLPGNWLMIAILFVFDMLSNTFSPGIWWWCGVIFLVLLGEGLEWIGQYMGGKKYGLSKKGNIGAFVMAILGSIVGVSFLFGFGALIGGLIGAYIGAFLMEFAYVKDIKDAANRAFGALVGKFFGLIAKLSAGIGIVIMTYYVVF